MPYEVADRGRPCPPTELTIEYARGSNTSNEGNNSIQQGQQSVNTTGQSVTSSCDRENRPASKEIHIEPEESLEKSHGQEVSSKRSFGGHTFSGGGDHSSASSFRSSKRRSWHRRPRHGPYRPRGHTFDSHTTSSTGPNANHTSKTNEPMDQENSSENKNKWRQRLRKPYAAPPCNTTQFLMDDHNFRERDFEEVDKLLRESPFARPLAATSPPSGAESDEFYSSPDDENEFQQRQFSQVYEYVHAERLSSMSKSELVQEYVLLEEKVEDLEKKLKDAKSALSEVSRKREIESSELSNLREQVILLTNENNRLLNISQQQQPSQQQPSQQQQSQQQQSQQQQSQQQQSQQQLAVTSISSTSITSSDSPGQTL